MIWENFKMALVSIWSAKLRSVLTMLGIIIGIASVVAINAIGEGVKHSVSGQISSLGTNVLTVTSGAVVTTGKDGKASINPSASVGTTTLTQTDVDTIRATPHIINTAPMMLVSGLAARETVSSPGALIIATTEKFNVIRAGKLEVGRFIEDADTDKYVVVLGHTVKKNLFDQEEALGKTITIRGAAFTVVGVMSSTDTGTNSLGGGGFDGLLYLPLEAARKLTGGNLQILRILTQVDEGGSVDATVSKLKEALKRNHGGQEDFTVLTQADILKTTGDILGLLATFISAIAAIALVVGGIGIMNIMLVSVSERTREIGIRKSLGATRTMILTQFLIEAATLCLIGGVLGIAAAYGLSQFIGRLAKISPALTLPTVLIATGVSVAVGVIFGIAPAIKAARKRPIEALRHE